VDDAFIEGVKANGNVIDAEGRIVSPQVEPPIRTNLAPEYHVTFLIKEVDDVILGYSLYAGLHDNGDMMLAVDTPVPPGDRE